MVGRRGEAPLVPPYWFFAALITLVLGTSNGVTADEAFPTIPPETPSVELTLRPAAAPAPALKYRFVRDLSERKPGNAVPFYYRAIQLELEVRRNDKPETIEKWISWLEKKPHELPVAEVRAWLATRTQVLHELRTALGRERCDWDLRFHDLPGRESISFLMSEIQESRALARILQLEVRLAIAEGRHADAVAAIRDGFQLATDIDRALPSLIADLVGLSIASVMRECVTDLIAADGSPNLYWALQTLPPQMVDFSSSIDFELDWPLRFLPFLRDAETAERSSEEWSRLLTEGLREVQEVDGPSRLPANEASIANRLLATGLVLKNYPFAKRELLAAGFEATRLERMPTAQVVAIFAARCQQHVRHELLKWIHVPYPEAHAGTERTMAQLIEDGYIGGSVGSPPQRDPLGIVSLLVPALTQVRYAVVRGEQSHAGLLVIEAIRLHMAENNGQLPRTLADIKAVPVPLNPATGKAFPYRLAADHAELYLPPADGRVPQNGKRYVLRK